MGKFKSKEFSIMVEESASMNNVGYFDALNNLCEKYNIDPTDISPLITKSLKSKLQQEAESLNLLKTKTAKLEI